VFYLEIMKKFDKFLRIIMIILTKNQKLV